MNPLAILGLGTGLAGGIMDAVGAQKRAQTLKKALSGPTAAEKEAQLVGQQVGGAMRANPAASPAAAARAGTQALATAGRQLAPQRAREEQQRALLANQADTSAGAALTRTLGAVGGALSTAGGFGAVTQPGQGSQAPGASMASMLPGPLAGLGNLLQKPAPQPAPTAGVGAVSSPMSSGPQLQQPMTQAPQAPAPSLGGQQLQAPAGYQSPALGRRRFGLAELLGMGNIGNSSGTVF